MIKLTFAEVIQTIETAEAHQDVDVHWRFSHGNACALLQCAQFLLDELGKRETDAIPSE